MERILGRLSEITKGFSAAQKTTIAAILVALVAAIYTFSSWASTTDMAPLYIDLETDDAAAITDELTVLDDTRRGEFGGSHRGHGVRDGGRRGDRHEAAQVESFDRGLGEGVGDGHARRLRQRAITGRGDP